MKILFIGDVVGKPGRRAVTGLLPRLRREHEIDVVIANGENSAAGAGLSASTVADLFGAGVDVITSGDHVWDQKDIYPVIEQNERILRPLNMSPESPGRGSCTLSVGDKTTIAVVNAIGRIFMKDYDSPFLALNRELKRLERQTNVIFVDFHAEATSEKIALGHYLDGRVSAVIGTHTHVQTSDNQVLPGGTAYLTDAGMTGPHDSVLGRETGAVIKRFVTGMPQRFEVATANVQLCGAVVEVDENTGRATGIESVRVPWSSPA